MIKRLLDIILSSIGLLCLLPLLLLIFFLIWKYDKKSPFYIAPRVGKDGKIFKMLKLRSMIANADSTGVASTGNHDLRITPIGQKIRKFKLDELMQLWNVLKGDISLVGPRPNVKTETDLYTDVERELLSVKPGITDFSSIVFADEGKILEGKIDPDLAYNQLIRPWKSRLGLIYIQQQSILLDLELIICTLISIFSRSKALHWVSKKLDKLGVEKNLVDIAKRKVELVPHPPPGTDKIVGIIN